MSLEIRYLFNIEDGSKTQLAIADLMRLNGSECYDLQCGRLEYSIIRDPCVVIIDVKRSLHSYEVIGRREDIAKFEQIAPREID